VTDLVALADVDEDEVLRLAASLESQSDHPIAAGIVAAAKDRGIDLSPRRSSGRFRARARRRAWTARTSRS
jgi:cation transport ATPase